MGIKVALSHAHILYSAAIICINAASDVDRGVREQLNDIAEHCGGSI